MISVKTRVRNRVTHEFEDQTSRSISSIYIFNRQLMIQVRRQVRNQVRFQVRDQVRHQVDDQVWRQIVQREL